MIKNESFCVDCGLPCIGDLCSNKNSAVCYCDECKTNVGEFRIDEKDLCSSCARSYLQDLFNDLSIEEEASVLEKEVEMCNRFYELERLHGMR